MCLIKNQNKWNRNWSEGNISIQEETYSLLVTDNKRQLIYDSYGKLICTKPYIFENGYIINKHIDHIYNIAEPSIKNKLITAPRN